MLTPSSIMAAVLLFAAHVERLQILDDAAAFDAALLEVMIEHFAHQPLRLGRCFGVGVAAIAKRRSVAPRTTGRRAMGPGGVRRAPRSKA
jgi:hypothetical protein